MRWFRALAALVLLAGVLIGVPVLLLTWGQPGVLLTARWPDALLRPDDGTLLLALLAVVGWFAWLALAATILAETVAVLTKQRVLFHLPGTGWLRPMVAPLIAAVLLAPMSTAHADVGSVPSPAPASPITSSTLPLPLTAPSPDPTTDTDSKGTGRTHIIAAGDELWSIAERHLGSGERWRDLLLVNPDLTATTKLTPGTVLQLPPDVVVSRGDSLWRLAERHLGDGERWSEIHELNRDLIADPDAIDVGWRLLLPVDSPVAPASEASVRKESTTELAPSTAPKSTTGPIPSAGTTTALPAPSEQPPTPSPTSPAQATSSPAPQARINDANQAPFDEEDNDPTDGVLGPISGLVASTLVIGLTGRRRLQLVSRAIGRRLVPLSPGAQSFWTALGRRAAAGDAPQLTPTSIVLGWRSDGTDVILDLEQARCTSIDATDDLQGVIGAMTMGLICAPWSQEVEVIVVGADQPWQTALDEPRIHQIFDVDHAVTQLTKRCATRRVELSTRLLSVVREDPDQAPAWVPLVVLFAVPLTRAQDQSVQRALGFGKVGVSVVAPNLTSGVRIRFDGAWASLREERFQPQLIQQPARRALIELFAATGTAKTEPAPWWGNDQAKRALDVPFAAASKDDAFGSAAPALQPTAPFLRLLGEPRLTNTAGERPTRAVQQCVEYCAWLLAHPSSTATTMSRSLCVAEGTRRSNLSRLRSWLGCDEEGNQFLPDAYGGRIALDERVTSDWQVVRDILGSKIDSASTPALRRSLAMVQGPPLGTALRRWPWARGLYDDMIAYLVDAACELADRMLVEGRTDEALWSLAQGDLVSPGNDEVRIRMVKACAIRRDRKGTGREIDRFLTTIRDDNRELSQTHCATLDDAEARASSIHR